ncbi:MAG: CBS domain-containing protein [Candidatus Bathyarchaeota archaeon]|nr:CBS domain-containing protein [Candidatus Bathyarchaeota archaeon]
MVARIVRDVFSEGFVSVGEDGTLSSCLSLFEEEMPPVLVVLDGEGNYTGVISRRWIIRSRLDPYMTKVKTLMRPAPAVTLHYTLSKAAKLMIESEIRQLPVYSGQKLLGFITDEDIIHGAVMDKWGNAKVDEIMSKKPFVVEEDESVGSVISLFREHGISHAPVVNEGKLVGIISIHDIIVHVFQPRQRQSIGEIVGEKVPVLSIPVKGVMSKPVITVLPEINLEEAAEKMHKFNISSLIVVRKTRPLGIVTKRDFLEPIAQMEMARHRLTVQFSVKDVEIDETQRRFMMDDFESFARKYKETLEAGTLFVYLKTHGTNYKGDQLVHCRLQLRTRKGSFFSSSDGWGVKQTFQMALDRLEGQILKSKEFERDPEFARKYLRRIRFPLTEL